MKNNKILVLSTFSALLLVATIIGCTGTGGILFPEGNLFQFFPPKFAYLFNGDGTNTITTFTVNSSSGQLTVAASGVPTNVSGCCQVFMDVDPTSRFLYVPNYDGNTVSVFTVHNDGTLTGPNGTDADTGGTEPFSVRLHPSGKFLYSANYGSDDISVFTVANDGSLTPVGTPVAAGHLPHTLIMDWQGRFLYVTHGSYYDGDNVANDTINAFSINSQTGALTSVGTFNTGVTPRGGMVDYSGQYLIVANRGNDNCSPNCPPGPDPGSVSVFIIGANGALTAAQGSPFRDANCTSVDGCGPFNPAEAIVNNTAYIGVPNREDATVSVFTLETATGRLTTVSGSPFDLGGNFSTPHYLTVDTSGKFAYVVDASNGDITQVGVGSNGTPTVVGTPVTDNSISWPADFIISH